MLFGNKESMDAEEFWRNREEELGEKVLGKTLGRVIVENDPVPLWGLFYTTSKAIYFQTFRSENWLSLLFSGGKGSNRTKDETIEIPEKSITNLSLRPRKGGFLRLMRQPPLVELTWTNPITGDNQEMIFEMEGNAAAFIATLPRTSA